MRQPTTFAALVPILLTACLTVTAPAQMAVTLATETDVGVFGTVGANSVLHAAAKGTGIAAGVPLRLSVAGRGATAGATFALAQQGTQFAAVAAEAAGIDPRASGYTAGTAATTSPRSVQPAAHSLLLTVTGARFQSVDVTMISTITGRPRAAGSVDIGADGNVEFQQAADGNAYRKSLRFTGTNVKIRITVSGLVTPGSGYDMTLSVTPTNPNPGCIITSFGPSCPNTTLTGSDVPAGGNHVMTLGIANALPNAPVAIVIGAMKSDIRIPTSPCALLTNPLIILGTTADNLGNAAPVLQFSTAIQGTGYVQAIPFDPTRGIILSSNGLRVDCL